ncbi:MAG: glycosyltransferase [Bacteroidetes bacterium]|nr:glycosyltransferase [Bacteroidota bacterium]
MGADFSIIIVNYRQCIFLERCISSIEQFLKSVSYEIIIVNNSPEEDLSDLSEHREIKLIESSNVGYAAASNLAVKNSGGRFLFFLNPDTLIENDFGKLLLNLLEDAKTGAAGLKLFYPDRVFQVSFGREVCFAGEKANKKTEKYYHRKELDKLSALAGKYNSVSEVDWVSGAALAVPRSVFDEVNGFDENFFLYYEDADLCKRIREKGYRILFVPEAHVIHFKGEITNAAFSGTAYVEAKKSQFRYYKKHCGLTDRLLLRFYMVFRYSLLSLSFKKIYFKLLGVALGLK